MSAPMKFLRQITFGIAVCMLAAGGSIDSHAWVSASSPEALIPHFSDPRMLPPARLSSRESHDAVGFILDPPPEAGRPMVSSQRAVRIADRNGAGPAETEQPILALLPAGGMFAHDTLVWVVRLDGTCVLMHGPAGPPFMCGMQSDILIDATTGRFIAAYSDSVSSIG
jgi:hypothetical protein